MKLRAYTHQLNGSILGLAGEISQVTFALEVQELLIFIIRVNILSGRSHNEITVWPVYRYILVDGYRELPQGG